MGSQGGEDALQSSDCRTMVDWWTHICVRINQEEQLGGKTDLATQGSSMGKGSLKISCYKICGSCGGERNSQTHRRVHWRDPKGLEHTQAHLPRSQH